MFCKKARIENMIAKIVIPISILCSSKNVFYLVLYCYSEILLWINGLIQIRTVISETANLELGYL
jgi:hypothetical protein